MRSYLHKVFGLGSGKGLQHPAGELVMAVSVASRPEAEQVARAAALEARAESRAKPKRPHKRTEH